jgi:hypothetical protein
MFLEGCTEAIFGFLLGHGKSPCFLRCRVLTVADLGRRGSVLRVVNIGNCLESAC